jgi:hypothetical protein
MNENQFDGGGYLEPANRRPAYAEVLQGIVDDEELASLVRLARSARQGVWMDVQYEMNRAIEKHGFEKTPFNPSNDPRDSFITLSEEVGEVAQTFTYDKQDANTRSARASELIQVAAMAMAMVVAQRIGKV